MPKLLDILSKSSILSRNDFLIEGWRRPNSTSLRRNIAAPGDVAACSMISLSDVSKQYGRQVIFVDASFQLNAGERAGLVGPNGAGKTTLFRMIAGEESADDGVVSVPKKVSIGYFRQEVDEMRGRPVLDEAIAGSGRLGDLHHELLELE